ncbi:MAG: proteasome subunit alpha [Verrucomicrobiota bacterium]|nr:proteasome subunit alpha [Verrucomicrobiota bacterium]
MNGDFLALLAKQSLGPVPALIPSSYEPLQATTVFAFHCAEGVIIAGDHRATSGNVIFSDQTEKILELDAHSLLAIAGVPAVAFEMARTLQTSFEFYRRSQLQSMSLAAKLRALSKLLRDNVPATIQGIGLVAPLFAGVEMNDPQGKPMIFFYDPLGAQFEAAKYAGSGSGSGSIKSVLHFLDTWGNPKPREMNLSDAIVLANRLLMTAAEFDSATGGVAPDRDKFATIRFLSRNGIEDISGPRQKALWQKEVSNE